jgi:hypothetical protein
MQWGVFAISAAHLYLPSNINLNVIDKKQLI